ncbi:MAG TPA: redoxin domain-containing protein [Acidimicrobiales bacterium]
MLRVGDTLPQVALASTQGEVDVRRLQGAGWLLVFGYPDEVGPVCTTELAAAAARVPTFADRGIRLLAVAVGESDQHRGWCREVEDGYGCRVRFPVAADPDGVVAEKLGLIHPAEAEPARVTYVVGPHLTVAAVVAHPAHVGRDWDELLRLCDALRLRALHGLAAPSGWRPGEPALVPAGLSNHEADHRYGGWWATGDGRRLVDVPIRGGERVP